jgi:hypothetical protein
VKYKFGIGCLENIPAVQLFAFVCLLSFLLISSPLIGFWPSTNGIGLGCYNKSMRLECAHAIKLMTDDFVPY